MRKYSLSDFSVLYFVPPSSLTSSCGLSLAMFGINSVSEVKDILTSRGTKFKFADSTSKSTYTEEDIITSVKKLSQLGSGFRTIKVGRSTMIVSVPEELDDDHMQVMDVAENDNFGPYGMVTMGHLKMALSWDEERAKRAMDLLLGKGMAWLDDYRGVTSYWFPRYVICCCCCIFERASNEN